jgi:uncharacterized protein YjbI with pentapeptide repeats
LVLIPTFLLLWMQLRFLAYQSELFTWLQAAAVVVDALLIVGFRMWFVRRVQPPETRWRTVWKQSGENRERKRTERFRVIVVEPMVHSLVPLSALVLTLHLAVGMTDLLRASNVRPCASALESRKGYGKLTYSRVQTWLCRQYHLVLREKLLIRGTTSPANINALLDVGAVTDRDPSLEHRALDEVLGLRLKHRRLRGANFDSALLPRADFFAAQLQNANFLFAELKRAGLQSADLRGALLISANLQGANLADANLRGAILDGARLEGANLSGVQLQGANLWGVQLQGADLDRVRLQGADLDGAQLQGANLRWAQLQGANLRWADLEWTDLTHADLCFADLGEVKNLKTAELGGADFAGADLTGTLLDINQPPPDVLPASCDPCSLSHLSPPVNR